MAGGTQPPGAHRGAALRGLLRRAVGLWLLCSACTAVQAQGLQAEPEALAPNLLSVPGEAMLIDPPAKPEPSTPAGSPLSLEADEVGLASWYGAQFHRRRTASGELFDMRALTAAHPTLPLAHACAYAARPQGAR